MPLKTETLKVELADIFEKEDYLSDQQIEVLCHVLNNFQSHFKNIYERSWANRLATVRPTLDVYKDVSMAIKALLDPVRSPSVIPSVLLTQRVPYDLMDFEEKKWHNLVVLDGHYELVDEKFDDPRFNDCLLKYLTPDVDTVVEFGAGWGKNLALLYATSGRSDVNYIMCEPSKSGREAFDHMFDFGPDLKHESHFFDYYDPSVEMLKGSKSLLAFTHASIEQIAFLQKDFVEDILSSAEKVTLIFYEPIGWQRNLDLVRQWVDQRLKISVYGMQGEGIFAGDFVFKFADEYLIDNSTRWSFSCVYNVNLLSLVNRVVNEGHARFAEDILYDVYGPNPTNPYTQVVLTNY